MRCRAVWFVVVPIVGCTDSSSRAAKTDTATTPRDSAVEWARAVDRRADSTHKREFTFPARSAEGGVGRFYQLDDGAIRIDVDDLGEMGRSLERFYARGASLRLAVQLGERYDAPMSGNVVKTTVDSTWFAADTAVRWRDSLGVVRVAPDTLLAARGRALLAEYQWASRMAGAVGRAQR